MAVLFILVYVQCITSLLLLRQYIVIFYQTLVKKMTIFGYSLNKNLQFCSLTSFRIKNTFGIYPTTRCMPGGQGLCGGEGGIPQQVGGACVGTNQSTAATECFESIS